MIPLLKIGNITQINAPATYSAEVWKDGQRISVKDFTKRQDCWDWANSKREPGRTVIVYAISAEEIENQSAAEEAAKSGEWKEGEFKEFPAGAETEIRWLSANGGPFKRPPRIRVWKRTDRYNLENGIPLYFDTDVAQISETEG